MSGRHAFTEVNRKEDCVLYEAAGLPGIQAGDVMPADLRAFYRVCGGLAFQRARILIVPPSRCLPVDDVSSSLYLLAEADGSGSAERIAIDLRPERCGHCYSRAGAIVAPTFTSFLIRLAREGIYWTGSPIADHRAAPG